MFRSLNHFLIATCVALLFLLTSVMKPSFLYLVPKCAYHAYANMQDRWMVWRGRHEDIVRLVEDAKRLDYALKREKLRSKELSWRLSALGIRLSAATLWPDFTVFQPAHIFRGRFKQILHGFVSEPVTKSRQWVLQDDVLIGKVLKMPSDKSFEVQLITDPKSALRVVVDGTDISGILVGQGDETLKLLYVSEGAKVKKGDQVRLHDAENPLYQGVPVGRVKSVLHSDRRDYLMITVEPLFHLEYGKWLVAI